MISRDNLSKATGQIQQQYRVSPRLFMALTALYQVAVYFWGALSAHPEPTWGVIMQPLVFIGGLAALFGALIGKNALDLSRR
jgi:RsiW-degrading membrane proteinase PrsW (M82 family)